MIRIVIFIYLHCRIIAGAHPHLQERQYSAMEQLLSVIDMVEVSSSVFVLVFKALFGSIIIIISGINKYFSLPSQVFLELAASRVAGPLGKWAAITAIVLLKTCLRSSLSKNEDI